MLKLRNQPDISPSASGTHTAQQTALCVVRCVCVTLPAPPTNEPWCFKTRVSVARVTSRPEQILGVPAPSPGSGREVYQRRGENQQTNYSASRGGKDSVARPGSVDGTMSPNPGV